MEVIDAAESARSISQEAERLILSEDADISLEGSCGTSLSLCSSLMSVTIRPNDAESWNESVQSVNESPCEGTPQDGPTPSAVRNAQPATTPTEVTASLATLQLRTGFNLHCDAVRLPASESLWHSSKNLAADWLRLTSMMRPLATPLLLHENGCCAPATSVNSGVMTASIATHYAKRCF